MHKSPKPTQAPILAWLVGFLTHAAVFAHEPSGAAPTDTVITPVMQKSLSEFAGKESLMLTIEYAPGAFTPAHKHNAHVFVYVLEGSIQMQVAGGEMVTLGPGQTFYEAPTDIHAVSRNASANEPAKFLVLLLKDKDAPPVLPLD